MSNILALDVGQKKIGVAVGATEVAMAFARPPILVDDWAQAWPKIEALVSAEDISLVVVGLPLNTDGTSGPQVEEVREFITELSGRLTVPVEVRDERLSTQAVQREQVGKKLSRGQEDSLAAQLILETFMQERHDG